METGLRVLDLYNIICIKKTWASTVDITDVNVFSGVNPTTQEEIDIKDYLIDMGELSYDFDEAEKENGENQLFFVSSDISFKLSGIENSGYLKTYFGLYANTDYIKWHVKLIPIATGTPTWEGLVNHESISLDRNPSDGSDMISITALSFEKEFKQFFQGKPLPSASEIFIGAGATIGGIGSQSRDAKRLNGVVSVIFPNTTWIATGDIWDWFIIRDAILSPKNYGYGTNDNYVFVKSSYERIHSNGDNCYDFFRRICNAMGWVFYYQDGAFQIRDRSTDIPTLTTLDVNEILDETVSKYKETNTFSHILILDGVIDGGNGTGGNISGITEAEQPYQMRGARMQMISDKNPESIRIGTWWQSLNGFLLNVFNVNDTFLRYFNENETTFNLAFHTKTGMAGLSPIWTLERRGCDKSDMLVIDAGTTGNEMWLYDVSNGNNSPHTRDAESPAPENQWTNNRIRYSGNYGSALVRIITASSGSVISYTYQDYVKTDLFFDNFQKFFTSKTTRKINIKYNDVITDPVQVFQFMNDSEGLYIGEWVINNMKINFIDETTEFELQKKLEDGDRR